MEALRRHPLLENVSVVDARQGVPQPPANASIKAWLRRPLAFAFNPSILSDGKGSALVKVGTFSYCGLGSNGVSGAHVRMSAFAGRMQLAANTVVETSWLTLGKTALSSRPPPPSDQA